VMNDVEFTSNYSSGIWKIDCLENQFSVFKEL